MDLPVLTKKTSHLPRRRHLSVARRYSPMKATRLSNTNEAPPERGRNEQIHVDVSGFSLLMVISNVRKSLANTGTGIEGHKFEMAETIETRVGTLATAINADTATAADAATAAATAASAASGLRAQDLDRIRNIMCVWLVVRTFSVVVVRTVTIGQQYALLNPSS